MAKSHLDKTITALAGEFFVAGQLCLQGYVASLTLKNYPGVDIFCLNPKNGKQAAVQVKTKRGGHSYYVPEHIDEAGPPFVFVYIARRNSSVAYYVVPAADVARISAKQREEYVATRPHLRPEDQPRMVSLSNLLPFQDRWDLLGLE